MSNNVKSLAQVTPTKPSKVSLGGVSWPFKFEMLPLMQLEDETGLDVMNGVVFKNMKLKTLVRLIAVGLSFEGSEWPGATLETNEERVALVAKGADFSDMPGMVAAMSAEFVRCFPKVQDIMKAADANVGVDLVSESPRTQ